MDYMIFNYPFFTEKSLGLENVPSVDVKLFLTKPSLQGGKAAVQAEYRFSRSMGSNHHGHPVSVAASVVGLLGVGAQLLGLLTAFIKSANGAPKAAQNVLSEVADISACLWKLQSFLLGIETVETASASRTSLILIEHIVVTLTTTVTTFSELEEALDAYSKVQPWSALDRYKWTRRGKTITQILQRLQASKASLHFMLTTLACASMEEAPASSQELHNMVQRVLESNEDISRRLSALEMPTNGSHSFIGNGVRSSEETIDDRETVRPKTDKAVDFQGSFQTGVFAFAFDQDLQTSRVCTRAAKERSNLLLQSGAVQSFSWSTISGISLSAVSNISVLSLPISPEDLWNGQHYSSESQLQAYTVTLNEADKQSWVLNKMVSLNNDELCREEETLRQIVRIQREIDKKSVELLLCKIRLRELEARLLQEQQEVEEKQLQELDARLFREQQEVEEDTMTVVPELQISRIYELASILA